METRAACSDGSSADCNFDAPWYYYQRGRFLRRAFFDTCLPLRVVVENVIPIFIGIGMSSVNINFEPIFEKSVNFGRIFEKNANFGRIFEKSVNFEHFVNGK